MPYNINSGLGAHLPTLLPLGIPGQAIVVGKAALARRDMYTDVFSPDGDGRVRFAATVDAAVALCTSAAGDVICVLPGHTETLSSATALALDVKGITVLGLGVGTDRPTFTLDTGTDTTIAVSAANVKVKNCIFVANFAAIVAPFTLGAAKGFTLEDCEFRDTSAILNFTNIVDTNATTNDADDLTIVRCRRTGAGADSNTTIVKMDGTNTRVTIKDNYFTHAATTGGGVMIIASGKVVTNLEMENNKCIFTGATGQTTGTLITTDGSTNSGYLHRNMSWGLDATSEILVTASSGFKFGENGHSGTADTSVYRLPSADS